MLPRRQTIKEKLIKTYKTKKRVLMSIFRVKGKQQHLMREVRTPKPSLIEGESGASYLYTRPRTRSAAETVESAALSLEGIDHVESCHSLPLGMLSVGD